jgi:hypothetical protein
MKNQASRRGNTQAGNIFFWLFLMIMLFGALSFVMSQGFRGGTAALGSEQVKLKTTEILDYATQIRNAVKGLQINGCQDTQINFETPLDADYTNNPASPSNGKCDLFSENGGKLRYAQPSVEWTDRNQSGENGYGEFIVTGRNLIPGVGTDCGGADCADLILIVPFVHLDICRTLNFRLGVTSDSGAVPPKDAGDATGERFIGTYANDQQIQDAGATFSKKINGCFEGGDNILKYGSSTADFTGAGGTYHFYQVLIAR